MRETEKEKGKDKKDEGAEKCEGKERNGGKKDGRKYQREESQGGTMGRNFRRTLTRHCKILKRYINMIYITLEREKKKNSTKQNEIKQCQSKKDQ